MKNLRFLFDNLSAIETVEDVKQVLRKLKDSIVQMELKQQQVNAQTTQQLQSIQEQLIVESVFLETDFGEIIAPDSDDAIETE